MTALDARLPFKKPSSGGDSAPNSGRHAAKAWSKRLPNQAGYRGRSERSANGMAWPSSILLICHRQVSSLRSYAKVVAIRSFPLRSQNSKGRDSGDRARGETCAKRPSTRNPSCRWIGRLTGNPHWVRARICWWT